MSTTKDVLKSYDVFRAELEKIKKGAYVAVGFQGEKGGMIHRGSKDATVADIATFNEYGTKSKNGKIHVPERNFVRSTMDENRNALLAVNRNLFGMIAKGQMTSEKALKILGVKIQWLIQQKITTLQIPPNHKYTIKKKKSSNPLIDTGQMRQSVTYAVYRMRYGGLA